jgi:hypothetical protein
VKTILLAALESKGLDPGVRAIVSVCKAPFGILWRGKERETI